MGKGCGERAAALMVVVVAMAAAMVGMGGRGARAQGSCVGDLMVCQSDIKNVTMKPDEKCCSSLKNAVANDLACLCNLYKSDIFKTTNLNKTRAMELPALCGINGTLSLCDNSSATPPSSSTPPAEATASTGTGSSSGSGAVKLGWGVKPWWAVLAFLSALLIRL